MLVVVDSNRIFSALLSKGDVFSVFLLNSFSKKFEFIAPEFLFFEISKHFDEIHARSKLAKDELLEVFEFIKENARVISFDEFNEYVLEAEKLAPHPKDLQYFALALASNAGIWSEEKAFLKQDRVKIFSTKELLSILVGISK